VIFYEMIGIELKRCDPVQLAPPLRHYISSHFNKDEAKLAESGITSLDRERAGITRSLASQSDLPPEAILAYYNSLVDAGERFPFGSESQPTTFLIKTGKVPCVKAPFQWTDSYRPTAKKVLDFGIDFEKACCIFDYGVLVVRRGLRETRDGQLQAACSSFKLAAGAFSHLYTTKEFSVLGRLSMDLGPDSLTMLINFALAQAQSCFFQVASDPAKAGEASEARLDLLAKLAMGTAELFAQAYNASNNASNGFQQWLIKCPFPWRLYLLFQHYTYLATALLWKSKKHQAACEYGEEIARLQRAKHWVDTANKLDMSQLTSTTRDAKELQQQVLLRLELAQKDNERIYFAAVPKTETLDEIEKKIVVQVTLSDDISTHHITHTGHFIRLQTRSRSRCLSGSHPARGPLSSTLVPEQDRGAGGEGSP